MDNLTVKCQKKFICSESVMRYFCLLFSILIFPGSANSTIFNIGADAAMQPIIYDFTEQYIPPGSNFTMLTSNNGINAPGNNQFPGSIYSTEQPATNDVFGTFDDSLICTSVACTNYAMTLGTNVEFLNSPWSARNIRVFAPGTYSIEACPPPVDGSGVAADGSTNCGAQALGNTVVTFTVGPGQLGGHMLFDWSGNNNIDVFIVWNINGTFTRPNAFPASPTFLPANTRTYTLASADVAYMVGSSTIAQNGFAGIGMVDGPFNGSRANFSLFLDGSLIPPPVNMSLTGGTFTGQIVDPTGGNVTIDSGTGALAGRTWDWSASDAALVAANTNGTASETFIFDPSGFTSFENLIARVTATDGSLSASDVLVMRMGCIASTLTGIDSDGDGTNDDVELCTDTDNDGVLDYLDPANADATTISTSLGREQAATSAGTFRLGALSTLTTDANNNLGAGINVSAANIGASDSAVSRSCVGGCFDFEVTGLAGAGSVQVVLPLSEAVPELAAYRKYKNGSWVDFTQNANNKIDSAARVGGVCPAPGSAAYTDTGLVAGNECIQLTIEDNGPNDTDSAADTIADPSGVAELAAQVVPPLKTKIDGGSLGILSLLFMFGLLPLSRKLCK